MPVFITTIHTDLPPNEVTQRLDRIIVKPSGSFGTWTPGYADDAFAGTRRGTSFKVWRLIQYRNSFLPVIRGRLVARDAGTDIRLVMLLHPLVAAFMVLWFGGLTFGVARSLAETSLTLALLPLLLCLFGIAVTFGGFFPEALKAQRLIRRCLQAA